MTDDIGILSFSQDLHILVYVGLLFVLSQAAGRLANAIRAPRILGYLVAGLLFGPYIIGIFGQEIVHDQLRLLTDIALGIIAFSIGEALRLDALKGLKKSILWISILQALLAALLVFCLSLFMVPLLAPKSSGLEFFNHISILLALILGTLAMPTAPAVILSVVHEYRAKGRFTTLLLGIIALDDALALILYGIAITLTKGFLNHEPLTFMQTLGVSFFHLASAIALGAALGWLFKWVIDYIEPPEVMLGLVAGAILLTSGLAISCNVSPLLANMALGFVIANFAKHERAEEAFEVIDNIEEPIFGVFFALAGAHLNFLLGFRFLGLAIVLVMGRFIGKIFGSALGAQVSRTPVKGKNYLGLALLPAAGVTVGLTLDAHSVFSENFPLVAELMLSAILGKTLINELLAPFFVRFALRKAGDINARPERRPSRSG